ncbi:PAAR motif of membran proteins [Pseudomonas phage PhiPA3]|uniref:Uncharacterized protein 188 n=1 Tax=Pseudomonas phage PhiPA3 TaxID=998086 RepID=F8SJL9_BPPA3|nr:PAAR motif of membran proteins [Pseudomonas phage PhiPA3]AEH03611.1 hypothetical protein [Pseudomonas phage PhiPA3]
MPAVGRIGIAVAGGTVLGPGALKLRIGGIVATQLGDQIRGHGNGSHNNARMVQGSTKLRVQGIPICKVGDAASCGHTLTDNSKMTVSQ